MRYIKDPENMPIEVIHTHLTEEEAAETAKFIKQHKADQKKATLTVNVEIKERKDLDFITNLLQRLNLKWTVTEG